MRLSLIVATDENWAIGLDNKMPWHLPADLKYFKKMTMSKPIIMGRKTFESIGKALPGRKNIVVTRKKNWTSEGVIVVHTFNDALQIGASFALNDKSEEVMVIGGAQIYNEALPKAQRVYLTRIHAEFVGDTFFPELDENEWSEVERNFNNADASNHYDYSFIVLDRTASNYSQD
ncbi:MAG: type 3 dihydrofolate reductase [Cellvibrionaceae bacterium]